MRNLPIGLRLTIFAALSFVIVLLAIGTTVYTLLSNQLAAEAQHSAIAVAQQTVRLDARSLREGEFGFGNQSLVASTNQFELQITNGLGQVVQRSQSTVLPVPVDIATPKTGQITWLGHPAAYASQPIIVGGTLEGSVQVAVSRAESLKALSRLRHLLVGGGVVGVVLLTAIGYLFSRRALRPVGDLTALATRISQSDLRQRLQTPNQRDEIGRLATAFNEMLDRLQVAFERQARFVSDASHELRTPLSVISGYASLLRRWGTQDPAVREEAVDAVEREAQRLQRLVRDLLFLARGTAALEIHERYFDIGDLVAETVSEARTLPGGERVSDVTAELAPLTADWDLLKQLLWILLDNAMKFTPQQGAVRVRAFISDGLPAFEVQDEGPGMSQDAQAHAFERFYRADPARASGLGTGLGLSIAREIADAHGAAIRIYSQEGTGTTVRIVLPRRPNPKTPSIART